MQKIKLGAWWIAPLAAGIVLLLHSLLMSGYAKEFPGTEEVRRQKQQEDKHVPESNSFDVSMFTSLKKVLWNPVLMLVYVAVACEKASIVGVIMFLQKIVHVQFHFTEGNSSLIIGGVILPASAVGAILGGYLVNRYEWDVKQILRFCSVISLVSTLLMASFLLGCGDGMTQELSTGYSTILNNNSNSSISHSSCRGECECKGASFKPICTENDHVTFYSPCHAGCFTNQSKDNEYFNCSCFGDGVSKAVEGHCQSEWCPLFPLYAIGVAVGMFFTYMNNAPLLIASLRLVEPQHQTLALGVRQILLRLIADIPGPVILGALLDRTCDLWKQGGIGEGDMNCLLYDEEYMRYYTFAFSFAPKFFMFVLIFVALQVYQVSVPAKVVDEERCGQPNVLVDNATDDGHRITGYELQTIIRDE